MNGGGGYSYLQFDEFLEINPHLFAVGTRKYSVNPEMIITLEGVLITTQKVDIMITVTESPDSCGYETISWPSVPKIVFDNDAASPVSITDTIAIINHPSYTSACPYSSLVVSKVSGTGTVIIGPNFEIDMDGSGYAGTFKFTASTISGVSAVQLVDVVLCGDEVLT
jgi:hypothetical protein